MKYFIRILAALSVLWVTTLPGAVPFGVNEGVPVLVTPNVVPMLPTQRLPSGALELYHLGDSFTYGANASRYTNNCVSKIAAAFGIAGVNLANGSFSVADTSWASFSGWGVTNGNYKFAAPLSIAENQIWTLLVGFNDLRTVGTSCSMYRKGLDHLIHWLAIPDSAKRFAQTPDHSTGIWTSIPWTNGIGSIGAFSSNGTLTFDGVIGTDVFVGYLGWATNFGGAISVSVDGDRVASVSTASVAYGNREFIYGEDAIIPDRVGPYGNGKLDFCPQLIRVTGLSGGRHTVTVSADSKPIYVLWVAGNGWKREVGRGPKILVGTIPRQDPWTAPANDALHALFNGQIAAAVMAANRSGLNVVLAPVAIAYQPDSMQSDDGVHPNDVGHAAIASAFAESFAADSFIGRGKASSFLVGGPNGAEVATATDRDTSYRLGTLRVATLLPVSITAASDWKPALNGASNGASNGAYSPLPNPRFGYELNHLGALDAP